MKIVSTFVGSVHTQLGFYKVNDARDRGTKINLSVGKLDTFYKD